MDRQKPTFKQPRDRRHIDGCDKALVAGDAFGFGRSQVKRANVQALVPGLIGDQGQRRGFEGHQAVDLDVL